jgi:hypothetical protein
MRDPYENLSESDKQILKEFILTHGNKQWFIQDPRVCAVNIVYNHPTKLKKTLQMVVNYRPMYEMNEILEFVRKHDIELDIIEAKDASI